MLEEVLVKIKKLNPNAVLPSYALNGDGAMDVVAIRKEEKENFVEYGTGLALEIPKGYVCLIFPRSSVTNKQLMLKNAVGVLDSGYRGELILRFQKMGNEVYETGEKVGQIMIIPVPHVKIQEVDELSETARGTGGFGSTGK